MKKTKADTQTSSILKNISIKKCRKESKKIIFVDRDIDVRLDQLDRESIYSD